MNPFSLKNRGALVTGSTRGIGAALAQALEDAGASLVRHGLPGSGQHPKDPVVYSDLLEEEAPEHLIAQAFDHLPQLDTLVCNAGSFFDTDFLEMDKARYERTMRLNVEQTYFLIQAFARRLKNVGRGGAIVVVSSINGYQAEVGSTAYDTSKGALVMMTRTLAMALIPYGIRVNGLAPGLIRTPITSPWMDRLPEKVAHYERKILTGHIGRPEDCAGTCVFLCSDAAQYIVGQTIMVDGGLSVGQIGSMP